MRQKINGWAPRIGTQTTKHASEIGDEQAEIREDLQASGLQTKATRRETFEVRSSLNFRISLMSSQSIFVCPKFVIFVLSNIAFSYRFHKSTFQKMAYYGVRISGKDRRVDKTRDDVVCEFANLHCDCDDENLDLSTVPRAFELPTENLDIIELLQAPAEEFDRERLLRCFKMDLLAVIGSLPYSTESTIASKYTDLLKVNPKKVLRALHYPSLEEFFFSSEMADEVKVRIEEDGVKRFHVHPTTQNHHLIESIMVTEQAIAEIQAHNEQTSELRMIAMRTNQTVLENRLIMVRMLVKCGCDEKFVHTGEIQKYYEEMTRRPLNGREWFRMFKKSRMISCFENFFYSDIYVEQTDKGMYVMMRRPLEALQRLKRKSSGASTAEKEYPSAKNCEESTAGARWPEERRQTR
ncbi:hypothetical protein L596_018427 [Steinernema carpocapsae]|uniref:DUF7516 domain-containing protein n=1 Tax=Steinernema carpocapsae TaxID=34508 RepID=A0A4U5N4L0_STECR|nr:hypothetical protein L596_018427 [Steinernema carpocapsae]